MQLTQICVSCVQGRGGFKLEMNYLFASLNFETTVAPVGAMALHPAFGPPPPYANSATAEARLGMTVAPTEHVCMTSVSPVCLTVHSAPRGGVPNGGVGQRLA